MGQRNNKAIILAKDFKRKAGKKYGLSNIILFGSQATGKAKKDSDIDLLVVSNKSKKKSEFMAKLFTEWHLIQMKKNPVDFICFTESEFRKKSKGITLVNQAIKEGIKI